LLVAPADPANFGLVDRFPKTTLPFPSILVGSTNDPWMEVQDASRWASVWGSEFINAGALGHINAESGLGDWPFGLIQLRRLVSRASNVDQMKNNIDSICHQPEIFPL
jgi:predicted alpha/beta hydrolase family esterase